jgi:exodeoxyribonuclease V alpha subunit
VTDRPGIEAIDAIRGKITPNQMNAAIPERRPATEEISGLIERVTFHNDESGFCVLRVKVRGQRDETTVIGSLPSVTAGEWLSAEGWWVRDKEHGLQFKATTMKTVPPTTAEGIERYLGSGLVKGIGPILARQSRRCGAIRTCWRRTSTGSASPPPTR